MLISFIVVPLRAIRSAASVEHVAGQPRRAAARLARPAVRPTPPRWR